MWCSTTLKLYLVGFEPWRLYLLQTVNGLMMRVSPAAGSTRIPALGLRLGSMTATDPKGTFVLLSNYGPLSVMDQTAT